MKKLIDKLREERTLTSEEFAHLLSHYDDEALAYINQQAREVATAHFGQGVYIRGLIEVIIAGITATIAVSGKTIGEPIATDSVRK